MRTIERFVVANTDFFNQKVSDKRKLTIEENNTTIVENWNKIENRWEFTGRIAKSQIREKYINQSLVNYIQKGNRNPIRYTF